ncbi:MAG: acyl-CoA dehydrogenase, partial [Pirellulaceae bacterium]
MNNSLIDSPDSPHLKTLADTLHKHSLQLATAEDWPSDSLAACGEMGVFRWFLPQEWGGFAWSDADVVR